jgi:predicted Zn-dependent peptidase
MEDIKRITPEEIRAFYKTYYVPNNALVVAVGAFKANELSRRSSAASVASPAARSRRRCSRWSRRRTASGA